MCAPLSPWWVSPPMRWPVRAKAGMEKVEAFMEKVVFRKTNLSNSNLEGANLTNADFKEADLTNANLSNTYLLKVKNLTLEQLEKVKTLFNAKMDQKLKKSIEEKFNHLFEENQK